MLTILAENPLLLLFVVAAIGYPLGRLKLGGVSLGVAAVLFVGIGIGALDERLKLPDFVYQLGLVLFVYTVGLSSGPSFFRAFSGKGIRYNGLVVAMLVVAAGFAVVIQRVLALSAPLTVGLFAGSLTNTPALAAVIETLQQVSSPAVDAAQLTEPVVGYSIAYPMGVIGMMVAVVLTQRWWGINYEAEARTVAEAGSGSDPLQNCTVRITHPDAIGATVAELSQRFGGGVVFGRQRHLNKVALATAATRLSADDLVTIIAPQSRLASITSQLGEVSEEELTLDRHDFDYRRIFVSNPDVVGHRLSDLSLPQQHGAIITRLRRGDVDLLPHGDTSLELGDRVRVLAPRDRMDPIARFFGDSYRALSEIDVATFSIGVALGLLLGVLPIPLPGGIPFRLGLAGGPLLVALVLGKLGRTGPLVWSLPYSANLTLRQLGLILFLAAVGTRSGFAFVNTLVQGGGVPIFIAGAVLTCTVALLTLFVGYRVLKIPMGTLLGVLAGLQTQPALLAFGLEQSENDLPNVGYTTVFPVAVMAKIILAQLLLRGLL